MSHMRQQLRTAAKAALTGLGATGANVFASRVHEMQDGELPGLRVYTRNEEVDRASSGGGHAGRVVERTCELLVEGVAKANAALDDTLDQIALEVEQALSPGLLGAKTVTLSRTEQELEGEAEKDRGLIKMIFNVQYYTTLGQPDVAL